MLARLCCMVAGALILSAVPTSAGAQEFRQERLFAIVPEYPGTIGARKLVEVDTRTETLGTVLSSWPGVPPREGLGLEGELYTVGAGRFVVWHSGFWPGFLPVAPIQLNIFDTQLGSIRVIENVLYGPIVAVDSRNARVFFAEPQRIAIADAVTGTISYMNGPPSEPTHMTQPPPAAYAADANRLFMRRHLDWGVVDVYDVASGTIVQTISTPASQVSLGSVYGLATDAAGTRLFTIELTGDPFGIYISAYDVATASLIRRVSLGLEGTRNDNRLQFDEQRHRLLVGSVAAFDSDTFDGLGATYGACTGDPDCGRQRGPAYTFFGPRSPLLFFSSRWDFGNYTAGSGGCVYAPLERRDPETGQLLGVTDLAPLATTAASGVWRPDCFIKMVMTSVPAAPRNLRSDVRGRQVTVSWTDPGNTTHFDVEAGSAPGLRNLYQQSIGGTALTVNDVPPGIYYVRVRSINYVGRSLPTEITVVVP